MRLLRRLIHRLATRRARRVDQFLDTHQAAIEARQQVARRHTLDEITQITPAVSPLTTYGQERGYRTGDR